MQDQTDKLQPQRIMTVVDACTLNALLSSPESIAPEPSASMSLQGAYVTLVVTSYPNRISTASFTFSSTMTLA